MRMAALYRLAALAIALPLTSFADITSQTAILFNGYTVSLDSGTVSTSGGDLIFNGTTLAPQGNAQIYAVPPSSYSSTNSSIYISELTQQNLASFTYSTAALSGSSIASLSVVAVHTNGGNYAKLLILESTSGTTGVLSFQFTTYGNTTSGTGGGGTGGTGGTGTGPSITEVQNNYSYIAPGLPNFGIAPGSLFIIKGSDLASNSKPALQSSAGGLPTTLNGASVSVTVGGTTVTPAIYYTSTAQIAAVLPSTTPVGTGTITVTYNGQTSATAPMVVVASALGFGSYYGTGSGLALATDANYNLFSNASSAAPGQAIILWGSGVGADPANDDKTYPMKQDNLTNIPLQVWIGGQQASIAYRGRSQFPGVDQVVVTIPNGVSGGCGVSIIAVSGNIVSNTVTLPVEQNGGACSDVTTPAIPNSGANGKVSVGYLSILSSIQTTAATGSVATYTAGASFYSFPSSALAAGSSVNQPSLGSCVILGAAGGGGAAPTGLDAGTISLSGAGAPVNLQALQGFVGEYSATLASIPSTGGTYTFNGSGGKDVGAFSDTINFPDPLVWTNQPSPTTTINRAQGFTVTWSGGVPGTIVGIGGQSTVATNAQATTFVSASFVCTAPVAAGQFTIPSWVLLALPPNIQAGLYIQNETTIQTFTASGLDYAYAVASSLNDTQITYQ
jgi:uncharacterized protein (TIGR03437 family)